MHRIALAVVIVVAVGGCVGQQGADTAADETGSQPTAAASVDPDAPLGAFDLDEWEALFDTSFTTENVTDSEEIRYAGDYAFPRTLDAMVNPSDPTKAIVQTSMGFDIAEPDLALMEDWLSLFDEQHPDATAWITEQVDSYLAAPGAEVSLSEEFDGICANLFTIGSVLEPTAPASTLGVYFEVVELRGPGCR